MRSDPELKDVVDADFFAETEDKKRRARELSAENPQWKRPFADDVAKAMDLRFLYKYGYDYGSMFVHPMARGRSLALRHARELG